MTGVGCEDGAGCWAVAVCGLVADCSSPTSADWASAAELVDFTLLSQEIAATDKKMPAAVNIDVVRTVMDTKIGDYVESLRTKSWQV